MAKLFAFEEDVAVTSVVEDVTPEELAADTAEVAEVASEIDSGVEATDEGVEAADQLSEVAEVVEGTIESGEGLEPVAAEAIRLAVESICSKVGASSKSMYALYATENFASKSSRVANSKLAFESITDTIKGIWEKIMNFLKGLVQKVINFWNGFINNVNRTQNALTSLQKEVKKLSGKTVADKNKAKITPNSSILGALVLGDSLAEYGFDDDTSVTGAFNTAIDSLQKAKNTLNDVAIAISKAAVNSTSIPAKALVLPLPFAKTMNVEIVTTDVDSETKEFIQSVSVSIDSNNFQSSEGVTLPVLTTSKMNELITAMQNLLKNVSESAKAANKLNNALDVADKAAKQAMSKAVEANKGADSDKHDSVMEGHNKIITNLKKNRAGLVAQVQAVSPSLNVLAVKTANAAIVYIKKSMALYK